MRFPSVSALLERAGAAALRFPWTLAAAALAAALALTGTVDDPGADRWTRLTLVVMLMIPFSAAVTLAAERRGWRRMPVAGLQLAGIALIALFYTTWPGPGEDWEMLRYLQLSAAFHLLVAVLPFIRGPETGSFWDYNRQLFLAFLRAGVFSAVLFVGLAIALGALDKLFGVHVPPKSYFRLWLVIALVGNTWLFLAALPDDVTTRDDPAYPRALKIFTQYVLTPLVGVYLVMLTAYLAKIVVTRQWPSGWIGWLVGSVSVSGILGFLLAHPLRRSADEGWIRIYARWLFVGLIPAAVMLLLALGKRIGPYGLTELRVIALVLGVWLLTVAVTYTLRPASGIRLIPLSLAAILAVLMAGPMNATRLAVRSQARRLERLLAHPAGADARRELAGATRYLVQRHAGDILQRNFGVPLPADTGRLGYGQADSIAARLLAARNIPYEPEEQPNRYRSASRPSHDALETAGYSWLIEMNAGDTGTRRIGTDSIRYLSDSARTTLTVVSGGGDTLRFDVRPALAMVGDSVRVKPVWDTAATRIPATAGRLRGLLALDQVSRVGPDSSPPSWSGQLLLAPR